VGLLPTIRTAHIRWATGPSVESDLTFKYTHNERLSYADNITAQSVVPATCKEPSQFEDFVVGKTNIWCILKLASYFFHFSQFRHAKDTISI
jgi:hypothetical protein